MRTRRIYYAIAAVVLLGIAFWVYHDQVVVVG